MSWSAGRGGKGSHGCDTGHIKVGRDIGRLPAGPILPLRAPDRAVAQLGVSEVEIGVWDYTFACQNPPGPLLKEVTASTAGFVISQMGTAPRNGFDRATAGSLGKGTYRVAAIVQDTGFLPAYVSERGKETGRIKPMNVTSMPQAG